MSRVVLVKLESDAQKHRLAPPYGILYLASALEKAGIEVRLHHRIVLTREDVVRASEDILADNPLFVGFSTLSGPSLIPTLSVSEEIRRRDSVPIVWGGLHATMLPEQVLAEPCVDVAVIGEGEEVVVDLARAFDRSGNGRPNLPSIPGLACKNGGGIHITAGRPFISNPDAYRPAWSHLDIRTYIHTGKYGHSDGGSLMSAEGRILSILTSRGCPWRCAYCYNTGINKRTFRPHSIGYTLEMVRRLRENHGLDAVHIQDDHFFSDPQRARKIAAGLGLPWSSSGRADEVARWGDGILAELSANGCRELQIGAESGSPRILEMIKKDITVEDILRSAELCGRHSIRILFSFMAGFPGETETDRRLTYDLMDRLEDMGPHAVVNGPAVYFPWPGTPLFDQAVKLGFKPPARTRDWKFLLWGTRQPRMPFAPRSLRPVEHYRRLARNRKTTGLRIPIFTKILIALARLRWRKRAFRFPFDYYPPRVFLDLLRRFGRRGAQAIYDE